MRIHCCLLSAVLMASTVLYAEVDRAEIQGDNAFDFPKQGLVWWINKDMMRRFPGGKVIPNCPDGRSGTCMKIVNGNEKSHSAFMSSSLVPVDLKNDTFELSIYVRGKGSFKFSFYCSGGQNAERFINEAEVANFTVDSQQWVKKEAAIHAFSLPEKTTFVRVVIVSDKGPAELYFDDFRGLRTTYLPAKVARPVTVSSLPKELSKCTKADIVDVTKTIYGKLTSDQESPTGKAAFFMPRPKAPNRGYFSVGVFDPKLWREKKHVVAYAQYKPTDDKYHWYKVKCTGSGALEENGNLYLEDWSIGAKVAKRNGAFDYWVCVRAEGPYYLPGAAGRSCLYLCRAIIAKRP